jgi:hypothetical protein
VHELQNSNPARAARPLKMRLTGTHETLGASTGPTTLLLCAALISLSVVCVRAEEVDGLRFPPSDQASISEEDVEFARTLSLQALPQPPAGGWQGPLPGAPDGMLVYGQMDESGGAPAAKFFVVGTIANASTEAVVATVEGSDFKERVRWDPSCLVLETLKKEGADDIVHWVSDFPWPLSDREFVFRRRLVKDGTRGAVAVSKAVTPSGEWVPVEKSKIRIRDFVQYSSVSALDDGSGVSIALLYRNNMEANLPPWVVNWFASKGLPVYLGQLVDAARNWKGPSTPGHANSHSREEM